MLIKSVCYNFKIGLNKTKIIKANHNIEKNEKQSKSKSVAGKPEQHVKAFRHI